MDLATGAALLTALVSLIAIMVSWNRQSKEAAKREERLSVLITQQKEEILQIYKAMEREFDRKQHDHNRDISMLKDQIMQVVQRFDAHCSSNHVQPLELRHMEKTISEMSEDLKEHHALVHTYTNRTTMLLDKVLNTEGFEEWRKKK